MTNDDIKNIFGISLESVRTHKYRLKKKMALSKEDDLRNTSGQWGKRSFFRITWPFREPAEENRSGTPCLRSLKKLSTLCL